MKEKTYSRGKSLVFWGLIALGFSIWLFARKLQQAATQMLWSIYFERRVRVAPFVSEADWRFDASLVLGVVCVAILLRGILGLLSDTRSKLLNFMGLLVVYVVSLAPYVHSTMLAQVRSYSTVVAQLPGMDAIARLKSANVIQPTPKSFWQDPPTGEWVSPLMAPKITDAVGLLVILTALWYFVTLVLTTWGCRVDSSGRTKPTEHLALE
ncbi:MAG: hypothetical protein JNJ83_07960 [Verrucomicrobiaceae bacterium]|nr:hypothetical protein [Verrucomicrobiaceae bacterium]